MTGGDMNLKRTIHKTRNNEMIDEKLMLGDLVKVSPALLMQLAEPGVTYEIPTNDPDWKVIGKFLDDNDNSILYMFNCVGTDYIFRSKLNHNITKAKE